jgi:adenine-specific DNA-methyltransferase
LESYEDTLNNLEMNRPSSVEEFFSGNDQRLREEYILQYMLDVESRGSASLLNTSTFADPRRYTLRIKSSGADETKETKVDLVETFNLLLGLQVKHIAASQKFSAKFSDKDKRVSANLTASVSGEYWFRQVRGVLPDGRDALVVWRTLTGDVERDEAVLLSWFDSCGHLRSETLDVVFVNGDCNLASSKPSGTRWEIESLETQFQQLMFDGADS